MITHSYKVSTFPGYCNYANQFPILTEEEEVSLFQDLIHKNNKNAANRLFLCHMKLVIKIAIEYKKYCNSTISLMDLIAEGNLGLLIAIKKFNPTKGARLGTYAIQWIRHKVQDFIIQSYSLVSGGTSQIKDKLFRKNTDNLQIEVKKDAHLHEDQDIRNVPCQTEGIIERSIASEFSGSSKIDISVLNEREKLVIENRYIVDKKITLDELSKSLKISKERVRQIESCAIKKLKNSINNKS